MADIVRLRAGETFPRTRAHVLVEPTSSGLFVANGQVLHPGKGMAYYSPKPGGQEEVTANALAWAAENGVPVVFLRFEADDPRFELPSYRDRKPEAPPTVTERALQLARTGSFQNFAQIRARLRVESYVSWIVDREALKQIKGILREASHGGSSNPPSKPDASDGT